MDTYVTEIVKIFRNSPELVSLDISEIKSYEEAAYTFYRLLEEMLLHDLDLRKIAYWEFDRCDLQLKKTSKEQVN